MKKINHKHLIKQFQINQSKKIEAMLLEKYFLSACKYAFKFLKKNIYSNLITYCQDEVYSYVYLSFLKALNNYSLLKQQNIMSFKNYLYQIIKYDSLKEIKQSFNWQMIPTYKKQCQNVMEVVNNNQYEVFDFKTMDTNRKIQIIHEFLKEINQSYAEIWKLKSQGFDKRDICKQLNLTADEMKSKSQYMKKLIISKYSNIENIY